MVVNPERGLCPLAENCLLNCLQRKQEALALDRKEYTTSVGTQSPGGPDD